MKKFWYYKTTCFNKTRMSYVGLTTTAVLLTACAIASHPDRLPANYISPQTYENYSCDDLAQRLVMQGYRIEELYNRLAKRHNRDQWQLAFSWFYGVSAAFIDGDGEEAELFRRIQGDFEALRVQAVRKDCGFEAPTRDEVFSRAKKHLSEMVTHEPSTGAFGKEASSSDR